MSHLKPDGLEDETRRQKDGTNLDLYQWFPRFGHCLTSRIYKSTAMDFGFCTMFDPKKYIAFLIAASFWWDNTGRFLGFFPEPQFS